ncbi:hypothetical protein GEV33_010397 [Tenebrio molitor]|uniref:Uncharacterized protein n=1 Tax=Tenebrio molitor TaxID=7067 RepID=A0A8J6H5S1_TENMO|nr:hypothetical protein GEV33_010397 [Tenebrio molitor]
MQYMEDKLEQMERHQKKNNIVIYGMELTKEKNETLEKKLEEWIKNNLGIDVEIESVYKINKEMYVGQVDESDESPPLIPALNPFLLFFIYLLNTFCVFLTALHRNRTLPKHPKRIVTSTVQREDRYVTRRLRRAPQRKARNREVLQGYNEQVMGFVSVYNANHEYRRLKLKNGENCPDYGKWVTNYLTCFRFDANPTSESSDTVDSKSQKYEGDAELFPLPLSEFRIHCRSTTGVDELFQPDEEPSQEIVVLADSTMLTRSVPADTVTVYKKFYP